MRSYRLAALVLAVGLRLGAQDAAAVLSKYVQVTGGADLYKKYNLVRVYYTVTPAGGDSRNVAYAHTRDGKTFVETDAGTKTADEGVNDGLAWTFADGQGAKVLTGKAAGRMVAENVGFDEDDWRLRYPKTSLLPNEKVNGTMCRHVSLTRTDGSVLERYYDAGSGLLVREVSTSLDGEPTTTDFDVYDYFAGIRRPTVLHVKTGGKREEIHIDSVTYSAPMTMSDVELPREVVRAIMSARAKPGSLPSAADLLDRYVEATGGKSAYDAIKSEVMKAEVTYPGEHIKYSLVSYVAGNKEYSISDIPSLGKFENGDDGEIAWEKSAMMGPKVTRHGTGNSLMGPDPSEVMRWSEAALDMETVSQDQVEGASCYQVRMGPVSANPPSACFDVKTGYLLAFRSGDADEKSEQFFGDYKKVNGLAVCHRIETKVDGHAAVVQIKEIQVNVPIAPATFDLPSDIQILKARRMAAAKAKAALGASAPGAPTLKRAPTTPNILPTAPNILPTRPNILQP